VLAIGVGYMCGTNLVRKSAHRLYVAFVYESKSFLLIYCNDLFQCKANYKAAMYNLCETIFYLQHSTKFAQSLVKKSPARLSTDRSKNLLNSLHDAQCVRGRRLCSLELIIFYSWHT
jgi:hypothetical protein